MKISLFCGLLCVTALSFGQIIPQNGVIESKPAFYAFKNATIYVSPSKIISNGTLLIKDDKIVNAGKFISIPKDAVVIDCSDKIILPAFIELYTNIGMPDIKTDKNNSRNPQLESEKKGPYYWNESIHPEIDASAIYSTNSEANKSLIEKGFGFALTHQQDGIARGKAAFVSLGNENKAHISALTSASVFSFNKGVSRQTYPSSQMGSIALFRQALYDAEWYKSNNQQRNLSLEALNAQLTSHLFFKSNEKWEILRAQKIAAEFDLQFNFIGSGNEYERVSELKNIKSTLILPLDFPLAYDVKNPYVSRQIPLSDLKHWELAPMNPAIMVKNGISICLTSENIKKASEFWENLRNAIQHGLTEEQALNALTLSPAKILGMDTLVGSLEEGKFASFIIYDKNPLEEKATVLESWLLGEQTIFESKNPNSIEGNYTIASGSEIFQIEITEELKGKVTFKTTLSGIEKDTTVNASVELTNNDINIQFNVNSQTLNGSVALHGKVSTKLGVFEGTGLFPNGEWVKWSAVKSSSHKSKKKDDPNTKPTDTTNRTWLPNIAYGFDSIPQVKPIVITNATLWTNEEEGIVKNATVIIQNGKITFVGNGNHRTPNGAITIDAKGKHVTSGIIDEHSHIAISRGVNEGGQAISAEVSIGDVVNPDDINIYRQLSGGVTASQLLHGSANPIGGQSALIKLKWGHSAEDMLIPDAPKFIKFALGENVKQSNWGDYNTIRFPQTRMGVEQVYYDGFIRAREYDKEWKAFKTGKTKVKPRKDLELEVLLEILKGERFISCHSYIQSEINMLMHVADSMGFTINTFTHILEGYKVADKMAIHGAGASTFSDWWAYKFEVNDAIPYNAKIMADQGIVVAINSDDAEMGRRLNQEAAKSVKYGGMAEQDAWKMVTLNPAKLLHLDDRMGSLKIGKDADVVIWSDNPLSIRAIVEYTIVDGEILFDTERDQNMRKINQVEKARIISKMLADNENSDKKRQFSKKRNGHFHCDTFGEELSTEENHH